MMPILQMDNRGKVVVMQVAQHEACGGSGMSHDDGLTEVTHSHPCPPRAHGAAGTALSAPSSGEGTVRSMMGSHGWM